MKTTYWHMMGIKCRLEHKNIKERDMKFEKK